MKQGAKISAPEAARNRLSCRCCAAHLAMRVARQAQLGKAHGAGINHEQAACQALASAGQQLEGFSRLNAADDAHQRREHARGGAAALGHGLRGRVQARIAGRAGLAQIVH